MKNSEKKELQEHLCFISGMTDSGSHGAGDDSETLTPIVIWGSAVQKYRNTELRIEQADLCPLMSFYLGLDYPVNSVGRLPIDYLFPIDEDLLHAYVQNTRQLLEQVHQQHDQLKQRLLFFKPFPLDEEKFFLRMESGEGFINVYHIKNAINGKEKKQSFRREKKSKMTDSIDLSVIIRKI